jgi:hypothetical protein
MPTNKQKIYDVVSAHLSGQEFSRRDLFALIDRYYPRKPHSFHPSDYLYQDAVKDDPSNDGNRHQDVTYPRFLERVGRNRYRFVGWDGVPNGAIAAPVSRSATTP